MSIQAEGWAHAFATRTHNRSAEVTRILAPTPPGVLSLAGGFPNPETFPSAVVAEIVAGLLRDDPGAVLQYTPCEGIAGFRSYLVDRQERLQGRRPDIDELIVTSGGMECMALLCQSVVDAGDQIAVEAPTYLGALMAFAGFQAELTGIPMDDDGMRVDVLAERLAAGLRPKFVYVIPDYQNPTGRTLTLARREALVDTCRRHGVLILEDVAYREMAFDGASLPSIWSLAPDITLQAGTFSKIFAPGVRLGWAVGPRDVIAQMAAAKQTTDQCSNGFCQRILETYGRAGEFEAQIPRSRALYASHWRALEQAMARHLPDGCSWSEPAGGFFAWLTLPPQIDADEMRDDAVAAGVTYVPGHAFYATDTGRNEVRLSFSHLDEGDLDRAVERLAGVIRGRLDAAGSAVPVRAVFLDVGETLVDETRDWQAWADHLGVPRMTWFGVLGGLAARGEHHRGVFERLAPGIDVAAEDAARRASGLFDGWQPADLYPDALPCLRDLKAAGYLVGIAGNQPAAVEAFLHELDAPLDIVASSASWGVEKPSPAFFARIVAEAGVGAAEVAYVGDRVDNDVVPAADAGMLAVHVRRGPWGHLQADWPEVARAAIRIDSLAELVPALARG